MPEALCLGTELQLATKAEAALLAEAALRFVREIVTVRGRPPQSLSHRGFAAQDSQLPSGWIDRRMIDVLEQ